MLLIEFILTFFAWRNGWKWLALIPVGAAFVIGFFVGVNVGLTGGEISPDIIIIDVFVIIALIVMLVKKGKYAEIKSSETKDNQKN